MIQVALSTEDPVPAPLDAVTVLTGGADRPYAYGLVNALMSDVAALDVVGNDELDCPELRNAPSVTYLNLRGDQRPDANLATKALRILEYYARLIRYAATAKPKIFHILWNNKFEYFDRTLLMLWYRAFGKSIVLTVHNVNARKRDCVDSMLNRFTLRIQYRLADHLFVHTKKMKQELIEEFIVESDKITVIPFGINNAVPNTQMTGIQARQSLGFSDREKIILFFGNIAPYKGLEYLVSAFHRLIHLHDDYRLVIAGRPKRSEDYWIQLRKEINDDDLQGRVLLRDEFIRDEDTELYMKAADVLVLPYRYIYQSGVLFLGYSFGLPVLAADVGTLKDEIVEGKTGFVFRPEDPEDLAQAIDRYFSSNLYADLESRRREIKDHATARNSWTIVGQMTINVYTSLLHGTGRKTDDKSGSSAIVNVKVNDKVAG